MLQFLVDLLTGNLVLVDAPAGSVTPPTPHYAIPIFFLLIPQ